MSRLDWKFPFELPLYPVVPYDSVRRHIKLQNTHILVLWWSIVKVSVDIRRRGILPLGHGSGHSVVGDKENPQHAWVRGWLDHSSEIGRWLGIQPCSRVSAGVQRSLLMLCCDDHSAAFPVPAISQCEFLPQLLQFTHWLSFISSVGVPERDHWTGPVPHVDHLPLVRCFLFGRVSCDWVGGSHRVEYVGKFLQKGPGLPRRGLLSNKYL